MIFSVFIRGYKVYQNINYIPISDSTLFSAYVGENGVGKSTVLEALDSYFNNRDWNYNHLVVKKGFQEREPYICPIFLIEKSKISKRRKVFKYLEILSSITWQIEDEDFNPSNKSQATFFCWHRDRLLERGISDDTHFLFPLGIRKNSNTITTKTISIFFNISDYIENIEEETSLSFSELLDEVYSFLCDRYRYIYIPSDINFEDYTKIEGDTVQALMGRKVEEIVKGFIKEEQVKEINSNLQQFMLDISKNLENYVYKKDAKRQNRVNLTHLSSKIVEAYFDNKVLNLTRQGDKDTPVYNLSSGEKRKALIDIARAFLTKSESNKSSSQQVVFAIDEPEISLHVASCYEQFQKLRDIANHDIQVVITTHWYGFVPIISEGLAVYMAGDVRRPCIIDLRCFRNDIKEIRAATKGKLPSNIELKGINDLVQSIISSITGSDCRWIICEGISDKIYLEHFLHDKNVYILPIGKSQYVKKIFRHLFISLEEERDSIKGRVFLLVDTDKNVEIEEFKDTIKSIKIRRLQNSEKVMDTQLKKLSDNSVYPPTEIEDTLIANCFFETIHSILFEDDLLDEFEELTEISDYSDNIPSGLAFNLSQSQIRELDRFFNLPGMKVKFALRYVENDLFVILPSWAVDIENFLFG